MKFIYAMKKEVSKDLEALGLRKIGTTIINGEERDVFENSKDIYLSRYAKNEIVLSNILHFEILKDDK